MVYMYEKQYMKYVVCTTHMCFSSQTCGCFEYQICKMLKFKSIQDLDFLFIFGYFDLK